MLSLLLMLACAPEPAPAPVCALDVTESLTFSAQADACDAEWITLRNTGDVAVYCALSEVLSTCQGNPFVLSEPGVSLSPGDTYGAIVEWCPETTAACAGTLIVQCQPVEPQEGLTCADQTAAQLITVALQGAAWSPDLDGDGATVADGDCDDTDPLIYPSAPERENVKDDDCDGTIDESTALYDEDGDQLSEWQGDCDDSDATISPYAPELEDGLDNECDAWVDEGTSLFDDDGDGYTETGGGPRDCDDRDPTVYPGAAELPDGIDQDCDGRIDDDTSLYDDDYDGWTDVEGDCEDTDPTVFPYAAEVPDRADNDCDGRVDEGTILYDDDGDGHTEMEGDCDDTNASIYPTAYDNPHTKTTDENCDGSFTS